MRWDKKRKFKPNDFYDFEHAKAALGYCDLFMTDKALCDMVRRPQLDLKAINQCTAVSNVLEAIDVLGAMLAPDAAAAFSHRTGE